MMPSTYLSRGGAGWWLVGLVGLALVLFSLVSAPASANGERPQDATRGTLYLRSEAGQEPAPTLKTDVHMQVSGMLARVKVVQRFRNPGTAWAEGVYVFPLPEQAAVDRLRMRIGARVIEGQIKERGQAKKIYTQAKQSGKRASLVEQERPNIFTTSVANIGPGEEIQVEIEYQQTLHYADGTFRLRFPLVVGPRYIPGTPATPLPPINPLSLRERAGERG